MSGAEFLSRWSRRKRTDGAAPTDAAPTCAAPDGAASDRAGSSAAASDHSPTPIEASDAAMHAGTAAPSGVAPAADTATPGPGSDPAADPAPEPAPEPAPALEAAPEPAALTDADMVPLDSLDGGSDLSAFFSEGVSGSLRRAALRRVFHAPKFNVRDGLNDYDGDFTRFEPLGDIVTSDMKFRTAREEAARLRELTEAPDESSSTTSADADEPAVDDPATEYVEASGDAPPEPAGDARGDGRRADPADVTAIDDARRADDVEDDALSDARNPARNAAPDPESGRPSGTPA